MSHLASLASVSTLAMELKAGDKLCLSSGVVIELQKKSGQVARLKISAPREVEVLKIDRFDRSMAR